MNGDKTISAKAADFAVGRGIIVVNSAGNEGNNSWNHIITPADADSVIAVGAVDLNGNIVGFSSPGPNAKNVIKPEVSAKGSQTSVAINTNASVSSGTSFSAPLIAGMAAGLKQQFPQLSAMKIREYLIKSSSQYDNPDNNYGYGIPNYKKFVSLAQVLLSNDIDQMQILVYPNPIEEGSILKIKVNNSILEDNSEVLLMDSFGKIVFLDKINLGELRNRIPKLSSGDYILQVEYNNKKYSNKLVIL